MKIGDTITINGVEYIADHQYKLQDYELAYLAHGICIIDKQYKNVFGLTLHNKSNTIA